jgi:hypothetical protein
MIIFARTRWNYQSYGDFWSLVRLSGFPTCFIDEIDPTQNNTYVFTPHNGEFQKHVAFQGLKWANRRAKIIWWMLERRDSNPEEFQKSMASVAGAVDEIWVSDRALAKTHPRFKHVILGSHKDLCHGIEPEKTKLYDFAHMSYACPLSRREALYYFMEVNGLRQAPNAWGLERAKILSQTSLMISVHQFSDPVSEPLRLAIAAAHKIPVLTETLADPFPLVIGHDLWQSDLDKFSDVAVELLVYPEFLSILASNLHNALCKEWTFRVGVEEELK